MKFWLLLIFALLTGESVTLTTSLYLAVQNHTNVFIIHTLFILITLFDIWAGYKLGAWLDRTFLHDTWFQRWVKSHSEFLNKRGRNYILVFSGIIDFPFLNGVIGSWLDLPFQLVLVTTFIGDLISYCIYWTLSLGIISFNFNRYVSIAVIAVIILIIAHFLKRLFEKKTAKKPEPPKLEKLSD